MVYLRAAMSFSSRDSEPLGINLVWLIFISLMTCSAFAYSICSVNVKLDEWVDGWTFLVSSAASRDFFKDWPAISLADQACLLQAASPLSLLRPHLMCFLCFPSWLQLYLISVQFACLLRILPKHLTALPATVSFLFLTICFLSVMGRGQRDTFVDVCGRLKKARSSLTLYPSRSGSFSFPVKSGWPWWLLCLKEYGGTCYVSFPE